VPAARRAGGSASACVRRWCALRSLFAFVAHEALDVLFTSHAPRRVRGDLSCHSCGAAPASARATQKATQSAVRTVAPGMLDGAYSRFPASVRAGWPRRALGCAGRVRATSRPQRRRRHTQIQHAAGAALAAQSVLVTAPAVVASFAPIFQEGGADPVAAWQARPSRRALRAIDALRWCQRTRWRLTCASHSRCALACRPRSSWQRVAVM